MIAVFRRPGALPTASLLVALALMATAGAPARAQTMPPSGKADAGTQPDPKVAAAPDADPDMKRIAACKAQALARLKERSPSVEEIFLDVDGLTVATADAKLGDTPVKGVIMGEAYIQRDHADSANRFLCLTGERDEVLFTFFTVR